MKFAIDFDGTFTAAPELWADFIRKCQSEGHFFYCVTARRATDENIDELDAAFADVGVDIQVVFASLGSKLDVMKRRGVKVDIWIDDDPLRLVNGH